MNEIGSEFGKKFFRFFHPFFDLVLSVLVVLMIIGLFITISMELFHLYISFYHSQISLSVHKGLFIFILVEMYQVLAIYLRDKEIRVSVIINIALVSIIRELIFEIADLTWQKGLIFVAILLTLATLYFLESNMFGEKKIRVSI